MKIFISWSGEVSRSVALKLKEWLPTVIQALEPFVSCEDIERGARWLEVIGAKLEETNFGIICVTPSNRNAPWIQFEAGALSKLARESRVSPLLIGLDYNQLEHPLSQFNATKCYKDDIFKLLETINNNLDDSLPNDRLEKTFGKWWPDLEAALNEAIEKTKNEGSITIPKREEREILEEILALSRISVKSADAFVDKIAPSLNNIITLLLILTEEQRSLIGSLSPKRGLGLLGGLSELGTTNKSLAELMKPIMSKD